MHRWQFLHFACLSPDPTTVNSSSLHGKTRIVVVRFGEIFSKPKSKTNTTFVCCTGFWLCCFGVIWSVGTLRSCTGSFIFCCPMIIYFSGVHILLHKCSSTEHLFSSPPIHTKPNVSDIPYRFTIEDAMPVANFRPFQEPKKW